MPVCSRSLITHSTLRPKGIYRPFEQVATGSVATAIRVPSGTVKRMGESRPELFRGRHFRDEIIVLCVRWYLSCMALAGHQSR
jgi:hypothetical protein